MDAARRDSRNRPGAALLALAAGAVAAATPLPGAEVPQACVDALRAALGSSASWTMERRLAGSSRALVSTGVVDCVAGEGISWRVLHPFQSTVEMTTNAMVFVDEDGRREKPLGEMPHYDEIRSRADAFARGDTAAFDGLFELSASSFPDGGWTLAMKPAVRAMRRLVESVSLSGGAELTNAVLRTGGGGVSTIRFSAIVGENGRGAAPTGASASRTRFARGLVSPSEPVGASEPAVPGRPRTRTEEGPE